MNINITGDLVINKSYDPLTMIDESVLDLFSNANFNLVNLEAPITQYNHKILKTGPHLKSDTQSVINTLKHLNISLVTLANNHIKDYDEQGVLDTIEICKSYNIDTVGAGKNILEASKYYIIESTEGSIAIINIAENEWSSADENSAGANGMSFIKDLNVIQEANKAADFLMVIVHGGHEFYQLPSPRMQELYRFYVDQGADLVVGHHPHCVSGYEIYNGSPIYYSIGNFIFTEDTSYEDWYTGGVLQVSIHDGKLSTKLSLIKQEREIHSINLISFDEHNEKYAHIESLNTIISNKELLRESWKNYIDTKTALYSNFWSPLSFINSKYLAAILRKLGIKTTTKDGLALYLNLIRCESHYDLSKHILERKLKK